MITHDDAIARLADRCYRMQDGLLVDRFNSDRTATPATQQLVA